MKAIRFASSVLHPTIITLLTCFGKDNLWCKKLGLLRIAAQVILCGFYFGGSR